jgi:addiction module RelE/StbE family toxin
VEIIWSRASRIRIDKIFSYIAQDSPERATVFIGKLLKSVKRLEAFPFSGAILMEHPAYRKIVVEEYVIVYQVDARGVIVATIISPGLNPDLHSEKPTQERR